MEKSVIRLSKVNNSDEFINGRVACCSASSKSLLSELSAEQAKNHSLYLDYKRVSNWLDSSNARCNELIGHLQKALAHEYRYENSREIYLAHWNLLKERIKAGALRAPHNAFF